MDQPGTVIPALPPAGTENGVVPAPQWSGLESLLAAALLGFAAIAVVVRLLGAAGMLTTPILAGVAGAAAVTTALVVQSRMSWRLPWRRTVSLETLGVLVVTAAALALAAAAGYLLPVWQWDALGYHLPYVNFALQRGTFADIPPDAGYVSSYPHVVEHLFIAWRAMLPDDRLVEWAHIPFGLLGALAIAAIAARCGARTDHAVAAGAVWLTLPAVFLQLPTNYTDVASAALLLTAAVFVLGPMDRTRVLLAGVAIGLFLGSKPQAPIAAALLVLLLVVRAYRAGRRWSIACAGGLAITLGAESYVLNVMRHGNPVWPVRLSVGPVTLPGKYDVAELLASGAAAQRTQGNVVERVAQSWFTVLPPYPVFDMRIGGLGLLFLVALPIAVVAAVRARSAPIAVVAAATLATPDPAVARYVLAFAGLVLALAVPTVELLGRRARIAVFGVIAVVAAHNLVLAYPGLSGEGPPLTAYPQMTWAQRARAVGADGPPTAFLDAIEQVRPGEIIVFDRSADLPYLAWPFDLSRAAERIPDDATTDDVEAIVSADNVRMLIVGDDMVAGSVVQRDPTQFMRVFGCKSSTCAVYLRRD